MISALRTTWVWGVVCLATQTLGCAFLLPDRIHWTVEPEAFVGCESTSSEPLTQIFGVTLSGGGSRAAVYAAAGLEALWEHGLLDRISHLSSVSGGSIAASYFASNRPACEEETTPAAVEACWRAFFSDFKRAMRYDFARATERRQLIHPNRWLSPTRRATSFREVLEREVTQGRTFGDLRGARPRLPVLLVNASSYDEARRFVFSNTCIGALEGDTRSASFSRGGCASAVPPDLPLSVAVSASAAFPGMFGPVALEVAPSCDVSHPEWWHLGDGGMIDNLGIDTLEELVLEAAEAQAGLSSAVLLAFDAGQILRDTHLKRMSNFTLLSRDPGRIVAVTKSRGVSHHRLVWQRAKQDLAERGVRADELPLRYMDAAIEQWPSSCWLEARRAAGSDASQVEPIRDRLEAIPTQLFIDDCAADLLELAAHSVVHQSLNGAPGQRLREHGIALREAND